MSSKRKLNAQILREMIAEEISGSISIRRGSMLEVVDGTETIYDGPPDEDEVSDFIVSNQMFDSDLIEDLIDPGFLGFHLKYAEVTEEWLGEFRSNIKDWSNNNVWLGGDELILPITYDYQPNKTEIWKPSSKIVQPTWIESSPTYLLLARDLIEKGQLLSELSWRDFEKLIGDLLEKEGWNVVVTQPSKDGGIDVIANKYDLSIGKIKTVWQAKKYSGKNLVRLNEVRELYAAREEQKASKALIVTTNRLTKDAIDWIKKDEFRFGYKDGQDLERWISRSLEV